MELINRAAIKLQSAIAAGHSREEGQALIEYALIITMISVASVGVLLILSGKITAVFTSIANAI